MNTKCGLIMRQLDWSLHSDQLVIKVENVKNDIVREIMDSTESTAVGESQLIVTEVCRSEG